MVSLWKIGVEADVKYYPTDFWDLEFSRGAYSAFWTPVSRASSAVCYSFLSNRYSGVECRLVWCIEEILEGIKHQETRRC